MFYNHWQGQRLKRFNALFPNEASFALDFTALDKEPVAGPAAPRLKRPEGKELQEARREGRAGGGGGEG